VNESNCPNCGAPVTGRACEYCGTRLEGRGDVDVTVVYDWRGDEVYRIARDIASAIEKSGVVHG